MRDKLEIVAETGFQFYGKMTASISHEIKNVLAIINENAGLLEDLALMAGLKKVSLTVMKQVGRADAIIKNMNRLGHLVDEPFTNVDLSDILELLAALSGRFASMRGVTVALKPGESSLTLNTSAFFLMNLLWLCLDFAMDAAGEDKTVELAASKTGAGIQVFFKGLGPLPEAPLKPFPAEPEQGLCELLGARLDIENGNREIVVTIAADIDSP